MGLLPRCHLRYQSFEGLTGAGESISKARFTYMACKLVLVVGGKTQFLYIWASPEAFLQHGSFPE